MTEVYELKDTLEKINEEDDGVKDQVIVMVIGVMTRLKIEK